MRRKEGHRIYPIQRLMFYPYFRFKIQHGAFLSFNACSLFRDSSFFNGRFTSPVRSQFPFFLIVFFSQFDLQIYSISLIFTSFMVNPTPPPPVVTQLDKLLLEKKKLGFVIGACHKPISDSTLCVRWIVTTFSSLDSSYLLVFG